MPAAPNLQHLSPAYFAFHIAGGHIGLPILVLTFLFAKSITRHPTLINFCVTWIIYSISYSIRLYQGLHQDDDPTSIGCHVQAVMIHGTTPMCVTAGFIVVIQVWYALQHPQQRNFGSRWPRSTWLFASLIIPYVVFVTFATWAAILVYRFPEGLVVSDTGFYCTVHVDPFRRFAVPVYCTVILSLIVCFEVAILALYFRSWRQVSRVFPLAERQTSTSMCFRVGVFNIYSIICLRCASSLFPIRALAETWYSAGISYLFDKSTSWPYMVQAALPLTAVIVFGTQKDLFIAWCICKTRRKDPFQNLHLHIPAIHSLTETSTITIPSTPSSTTIATHSSRFSMA
ncbi:hypothetical protein HGRIS_008222 [Hohenbuehelia grisea]|uniref:Pheromone receptor n=1 Tax=Hohenbuehelia grisea TaxID=104357 RepID=A0ABR3J7R5_9AGAR